MSFEIVTMTRDNMNLMPNHDQPYEVIGRMRLLLNDGEWSYEPVYLDTPWEKTFPQEEMELDKYLDDPRKTVLMALDGGQYAGAVRLRCDWNLYGFIDDIGIDPAFRRKGAGRALMEAAEQWAKAQHMQGLALEAQDINLHAARFYERCGFEIGGVNTMLYENFGLKEIAVFWYKRFSV